MVHLAQTMDLSCTDTYTISNRWNEILHDPRHLVVPSGAPKMISKPTVCLAQTVHLSWIKISTISKWTKTSFPLSLITKECHPMCPKWIMSQWYVWRKQCTYLAPKLTLSPNGPNRDSTWPTPPSNTIGCIRNDFWRYGTFSANFGSILHWH
jgi:hypothetical protein